MELKIYKNLNSLKEPQRFLRVSLLILLSVFLVITAFAYQNKALSLHFVDEEHNFVLGKYLLQGEKLYSDMLSFHQPLPFILSAAVQKITNPNSIFLLVKRHREFMIGFSAISSLFLVFRFGWPIFSFVIIFELTKIFLLGNLFLAESLSIYPLLYILSSIFLNKEQPRRWELILIGLCFMVIGFLLAPFWPLVFVLFLVFLAKNKNYFETLKLILIGGSPILILTFWFSSLKDYIFQTAFLNLRYVIPNIAPEPFMSRFFKAAATPVLSFFSQSVSSHTLLVIQILSLLFLINLFLLLIKQKIKLVIVLIFILFLANPRSVLPGDEFYRGFHLLPWFATLIFLTIATTKQVTAIYHQTLIRISTSLLLLAVIVISFNQAQIGLFRRSDLARDLYINYSQQFSLGEAVRIMSIKEEPSFLPETLLVVPDEWLIYWQSGLKPPLQINHYYGWMDKVPYLRFQLDETFIKNTPTYLYCSCDKRWGIGKYLGQYKEMKKDGKTTMLYILPQKFSTLTQEQIDQLLYYGFSLD